jgi:hypothetical protein
MRPREIERLAVEVLGRLNGPDPLGEDIAEQPKGGSKATAANIALFGCIRDREHWQRRQWPLTGELLFLAIVGGGTLKDDVSATNFGSGVFRWLPLALSLLKKSLLKNMFGLGSERPPMVSGNSLLVEWRLGRGCDLAIVVGLRMP